MRWIRFTVEDRTVYGIVEGDRITEVTGDPFVGHEVTTRRHDLSAVKIEVPVWARTFYCAGYNYTTQFNADAEKLDVRPYFPDKNDVGYRAVNALIAHGESVVIPADATDSINYEGELAVIIGKKAKHLSEADALGCVLGYSIGNDVCERHWQKIDRTYWRSKNADTFKPMGPWIETDFDIEQAETVVRLNGVETTRFQTGAMVHGVAQYISTMTRYLTLYPGDILWMGTDGPEPVVRAGDVVEVDITGIGTLTNPFVKEILK